MRVGVDMGGTKTRIAVFGSQNATHFREIAQFPTAPTYADQVTEIVAAVRSVEGVQGVGLALGAQLTRDGQGIDVSYTMPDMVGKPLIADLVAALGMPVRATNDNVCANLAETFHGVLTPYERAAYLTVSTGTGAGVRLGRPESGAFLYLSQVGHHMIDPHGARCTCGQIGCVQAITGGQSILKRYGAPAAALDDDAAWQEITDAIATAIVNLARVTRVDAVGVGGGIGFNARSLRAHLVERVREKSPGLPLAVHFVALGEDAPLVGGGDAAAG
jgi:glucokinase